ncbi:MAG: 1,4-alpha-glucan branching protein GlgB [Acetobacterales bacterium]
MTDREMPTAAGAKGLDPEAINAIAEGRHCDPFAVLGLHSDGNGGLSVRVFAPEATAAEVVESGRNRRVASLEKVDDRGFFAGPVGRRKRRFAYRLHLSDGQHDWIAEDPYRFPPILGDLDIHLLSEGRHFRLYDKLGAHPAELEGVQGVAFAVWAPSARRVSVVGPFNRWDGRRHPMRLRHSCGVWELFIPGLGPGETYNYELLGADGTLLPLKADPVAFADESAPRTGSIVVAPLDDWSDDDWMAIREPLQSANAPISVYECHLGSWQRGEDGGYLTYEALAERLVPYVRELGFTHIELMPLHEHPFTGSWGYQPTGLYAPTARYGSPQGFKRFVEACHEAEIGVLLDWVPGHFPDDAHGLARFDGTALYEHEDPRIGMHKDWDTLIYNFGRTEVANFLIANALYWLEHFHIDGLRVDAVASMLYLDYSRSHGEWIPNRHGGNENLDAIALLKGLNEEVRTQVPGAITVAEESTAWPGVSSPTEAGGLGFRFKWNMGWMHDTLSYMSQDPVYRRHRQHELTFGIDYAFSEKFVLPLSHDEVVYGKGSLLTKMPGDRWQKFANLRAYLTFMWTHPGKKLLFMGGEFAQEREWNHDTQLDWHLMDDEMHAGIRRLVTDLNRLYRQIPALHVKDCEPDGFEWIDASNADMSVLCFLRKGREEDQPVLVACNMTPIPRQDYRIGVPRAGYWRELFNSDAGEYGGSGHGNMGGVQADDESWHGRPCSLDLTLPPLATIALTPSTS